MTTVTLNINEALLEKAKNGMRDHHVTLDEVVERAIMPYVKNEQDMREYDEFMAKLRYVKSAGPYTRDEMNER